MAVRFATATRNAAQDARAAKVDGGAGPGYLEVRTGAQPANANTAASGTLLVTITLDDPAFGAGSSAGVLTADVSGTPTGTAVATGTAGWGRIYDSAGNAVVDGSVTASGGGGDFIISSTSITSGQDVELTSLTITDPAS